LGPWKRIKFSVFAQLVVAQKVSGEVARTEEEKKKVPLLGARKTRLRPTEFEPRAPAKPRSKAQGSIVHGQGREGERAQDTSKTTCRATNIKKTPFGNSRRRCSEREKIDPLQGEKRKKTRFSETMQV